MSDPHRDMLPMHEAQHSFDVVLRGYDRHQVAETVERLEADFRIALADRDAAVARSSDLAGQVSALHGEVEALRRKAATAAAPTFENMSERIAHMLRLADEEATEIRRAAEQEAQAVREQTAAEERAMHERHAAGREGGPGRARADRSRGPCDARAARGRPGRGRADAGRGPPERRADRHQGADPGRRAGGEGSGAGGPARRRVPGPPRQG